MPYFPVDDDMAFHPKIMGAGNEAIGLWTRAGALCKKHATGGFVPTETARALGPKKLADKLVTVGLWTRVDGGYQFHDWTKQAGNADAADEKARAERARERNAARQRDYRARNADRNGVTNAPVTDTPSPSPNDLTKTSPSQSPTKRASVSTDSISPMTLKLAGQAGITSLPAVADTVRKHTGKAITPDAAYRVCAWILGKSRVEPHAPQRYVTGAISRSPFEVQQFIDEQGLEVAS